ncbi:MAG: hypothetical protein JO278_14160 [Dyella sp.]|nr:hypothetical protein [Dyella sp.]
MNMKQAIRSLALLALTACASTAASAADAARPLALRVQHELSALGRDGVKRDVSFGERVYRSGDTVWIERELPRGAQHGHDEAEHAKSDRGHKHMDVSTAARWIERKPDGNLTVRLVSDEMRKTFEVRQGDYSNIGFDGSWAAASHLLDPALLKTMKASGPARDGVQEYTARRGDDRVTVQWDVVGQYPRLVQSVNASGTQKKITRVTSVAVPATAPWNRTRAYAQGDYADLLD